MDKKKINITVLGIAFSLLAVIACIWILKSEQGEQRERDEITQIFRPFQSYGLIYNEKENRLYYNGELVRYFEDIVSTDYNLEWPNQNGAIDVCTERSALGEIIGVYPFSQQEFSDRTSSLKTAICELEISNTIDGYTSDMESERLYYDGELVGYFEDKQISHFFGPYEDSTIKIYAIRDKSGVLTGLDVNLNNDDNEMTEAAK